MLLFTVWSWFTAWVPVPSVTSDIQVLSFPRWYMPFSRPLWGFWTVNSWFSNSENIYLFHQQPWLAVFKLALNCFISCFRMTSPVLWVIWLSSLRTWVGLTSLGRIYRYLFSPTLVAFSAKGMPFLDPSKLSAIVPWGPYLSFLKLFTSFFIQGPWVSISPVSSAHLWSLYSWQPRIHSVHGNVSFLPHWLAILHNCVPFHFFSRTRSILPYQHFPS